MLNLLKRRIPHPIASAITNYIPADLPGPGTQNLIFEPSFQLPVFEFQGAGKYAGTNRWRAYQPPQVWVRQAVPQAGLGGLQAGSLALQGLIDDGATPTL